MLDSSMLLDMGIGPDDESAEDYHRKCGFLWEQHEMFDVPIRDPESGEIVGQEYECPKRLIIAGGRSFQLAPVDIDLLDKLLPVGEVVSGGARGVDSDGEEWAEANGIPVVRFLPDWDTYGKAAGPIRNREMAEYATAVVLFPGGRGTESMHKEAMAAGLDVYNYRYLYRYRYKCLRNFREDWIESEPETPGFPTQRDFETLVRKNAILYNAISLFRHGSIETWEETLVCALVWLAKENDALKDELSSLSFLQPQVWIMEKPDDATE